MNFDTNFDFNDYDETPFYESKARFDLDVSIQQLVDSFEIPKLGFSKRIISPIKGFSSCSLICAIAEKNRINSLYATTLRVGKKEAYKISDLDIKNVNICLCDLSKENGKYDYTSVLEEIAKDNNWNITYSKNHSKIILLELKNNYIVIETSSNLNENPKIEQFCITNDKGLYDFYLLRLKELNVF